jgi:pimeloyl-ACP methyl ester carboxylesterase
VQFAERLRELYPSGVRVEVYENHKADEAEKAILSFARAAREGKFTAGAPSEPRVILYGHSWGAAATVSLARQLGHDGVPVSLTVQIDSVAPVGKNDALIPPNVARAVNFYQSNGLLHGRTEIKAEDPKRTRILGNFRYDYQKDPVSCKGYPWWNYVFSKTHMEIECDPKVWSQVESMIRSELEPVQARGGSN